MNTIRLHAYADPLSEESLERYGIAGCLLTSAGDDGIHLVDSMTEVHTITTAATAAVGSYVGVVVSWCLNNGYVNRKDVRITEEELVGVSAMASVALTPAVSHPLAVFAAMHCASVMLGDNIVLRHQLRHPDAPLHDAYDHAQTEFETKTDLIASMADDLKEDWESDAAIIEAAGSVIAAFTAAVWCSNVQEQHDLMHGSVHAFSHSAFTVAVLLPLLGAVLDTSMEIKPWKYIGMGDTQVQPERVELPDDVHLWSNVMVPMALRIPHEVSTDDIRNN